MAGINGFPHYSLSDHQRGRVVIINVEEFEDGFPKADRQGSFNDVVRLQSTFRGIGFKDQHIDVLPNPSYQDIMKKINDVAHEDHTDNDMFVCVVMTHGSNASGCLCASDKEFKTSELWKPFSSERCPSLEGKPKLFIIQACRGKLLDDGVKVAWPPKNVPKKKTQCDWSVDGGESGRLHQPKFVRDSRTTPTATVRQYTEEDISVNLNCIHEIPDTLVAYSSLDPFYSFLTTDGSPFIQTLCDKLEKFHATKDLQSILTFVNANMAINIESKVKDPYQAEFDKSKQMSCFASTFTKLLVFSDNIGA